MAGKNVKEMTVTELKATGFEVITMLDNIKYDLKLITDELALRSQATQSSSNCEVVGPT
jgi:hypothetical protein